MARTDAQNVLVAAGCILGSLTYQNSGVVPSGQVISQNPEAGTLVVSGAAVALVLSEGPVSVLVPNVVGMTQTEAQAALGSAGLQGGTITRQSSATVPVGQVISQDPASGSGVASGTAVVLVISDGPSGVAVPNLAGHTQQASAALLVSAGLQVGSVSQQYHATIPAGAVVGQIPAAGTQAAPGTAVSFALSMGPFKGGNPLVLFDNSNNAPVSVAPTAETVVVLAATTALSKLVTWHETPSAQEGLPRTLALRDASGVVFGAWPAVATPDGNGESWVAVREVCLPAGTYYVVDSDPSTWRQNSASDGAGFARLEGSVNGVAGSGGIDASGGTVTGSGGLKIMVPAGSFEGSASLSVTVGAAASASAAPVYFLDGLPPKAAMPITVEFPLVSTAVQGEAWLSLQRLSMRPDGGQQYWSNCLIPGVVEGATLRAEIPAYDLNELTGGAKAVVSTSVGLSVTTGFTSTLSTDGRFRIVFPADYAGDNNMTSRVETLAGYFVAAYQFLTTQVGLSFRNRSVWPIDVGIGTNNVVSMSDEVYAMAEQGIFSRNNDYIQINRSVFEADTNATLWRASVVHELFHLAQYNYVPIGFFNGNQAGEGGWLYDASSTWSEWAFTNSASYWPNVLNSNPALFPLNGLFRARSTYASMSRGRSADAHGYAASVFLRYLTERAYVSGNGTVPLGILGTLWTQLAKSVSVTNALWQATGDPSWQEKWEDFGQSLYSGGLSGWNPVLQANTLSLFVRDAVPDSVWTCTKLEDALSGREFTGAYYPLSAFVHTLAFDFDIQKAAQMLPNAAGLQITAHNLGPSMRASVWCLDGNIATCHPLYDRLENETRVNVGLNPCSGWNSVTYPSPDKTMRYARFFIVVTNSDATSSTKPVNASFSCRFGSNPVLSEVRSKTKSVSVGVAGSMMANGTETPLEIAVNSVPITWNVGGTQFSGADTTHDESSTATTEGILDIQRTVAGDMHASGGWVYEVTATDRMELVEKSLRSGQWYTFTRVIEKTIHLFTIPFAFAGYTYSVQNDGCASSSANDIMATIMNVQYAVTETSNDPLQPAGAPVNYTADTYKTVNRVSVSFQ
jgi:beta-lactam-binding protein with PASTA domain